MDEIEQRVRATVEATDAGHEFVPCDPSLADTAAFCETYGYRMEDSANCIVVATKEDSPRVVACVVLATSRLDVNGTVRRRLGARKGSFASAEMTEALTGMALGGGSRTMKVVGSPALLPAVGAEIVDGLAKPPPDPS